MKRTTVLLPLLGLLVLAMGLAARVLRGPGLALEPFPDAPQVHLPPVDVALGAESLAGAVRGADGLPVADALVSLAQDDEPVWTYTDARGRFELTGLWPGAHELVVWSRRHHMQGFAANAPDRELVLALERPYGEPDELPPLVRTTLRGEIVPAVAGRSLEGYELVLSPALPVVEFGAPVERRAAAAADGGFEVPDLILGDYRVAVLPPWARGGRWPDLAAPDARAHTHTRAAARERLAVRLAAGELFGVARNDEGEALEGALVLVHPRGEPLRPWPPVATDPSGAFRVGDLPPGDYALELRAGEAELRLDASVEDGATLPLAVPPLVTRAGDRP